MDVDKLIDDLFKDEIIYNRLVERIKYRLTNFNPYIVAALEKLNDGEIDSLLRTIHQQDEDIRFLTCRLSGYESLMRKYEKLSIKVVKLKKQNHRLLSRNSELYELLKTKNNS